MIEDIRKKYREDVASYFTRCRKAAKCTQSELAALSGMAPANISRFESGHYNPSLDTMVRVAEAMGMRLEIRLVKKRR